jgi:hypothetical protein
MPGEGLTILAPKDRGVEDRQKAAECIRTGRIRSADFIDLRVIPDAMPDACARLATREAFSMTCQWT